MPHAFAHKHSARALGDRLPTFGIECRRPPFAAAGAACAIGSAPGSRGGGMPSGHAQAMGVFAGFLTLHLLLLRPRRAAALAALPLVWALALAVCAQRTAACHTPAQVAVGLALGLALGAGGYAIARALLHSCSRRCRARRSML